MAENGIMYILSLVAIVGIVAIVLGMNQGSSAPQVVTVPTYSEDLSVSEDLEIAELDEEGNIVGFASCRDYGNGYVLGGLYYDGSSCADLAKRRALAIK